MQILANPDHNRISYPVGYQNCVHAVNGYKFIVPTFEKVGSESQVDLQDIKVIGGKGMMGEQIKVYGSDARATGELYYYFMSSTSGGYYEDGWYSSSDMKKKTGVKIPRGGGLYFYCTDPTVQIQFAGKVSSGAQTNSIECAGYNVIGNSTPRAIDLQEISLVGAAGMMGEQIKVYGSDARATGELYYYFMSSTSGGYYEDGWYSSNDMTQKKTGVTYQPGEGFYFYCNDTNVKVVLPAAL